MNKPFAELVLPGTITRRIAASDRGAAWNQACRYLTEKHESFVLTKSTVTEIRPNKYEVHLDFLVYQVNPAP